jgi:hypothetical protein
MRHNPPGPWTLVLVALAMLIGCSRPCDNCCKDGKCPPPAVEPKPPEPKPDPSNDKPKRRPFREDGSVMRMAARPMPAECVEPHRANDVIEWAAEIIRREYQQRDDDADIGTRPRASCGGTRMTASSTRPRIAHGRTRCGSCGRRRRVKQLSVLRKLIVARSTRPLGARRGGDPISATPARRYPRRL